MFNAHTRVVLTSSSNCQQESNKVYSTKCRTIPLTLNQKFKTVRALESITKQWQHNYGGGKKGHDIRCDRCLFQKKGRRSVHFQGFSMVGWLVVPSHAMLVRFSTAPHSKVKLFSLTMLCMRSQTTARVSPVALHPTAHSVCLYYSSLQYLKLIRWPNSLEYIISAWLDPFSLNNSTANVRQEWKRMSSRLGTAQLMWTDQDPGKTPAGSNCNKKQTVITTTKNWWMTVKNNK